MTSDKSTIEPGGEARRPELPKIVDIAIEVVPYEPERRLKFLKSDEGAQERAVQFTVRYEGEFPLDRAVTPILYVGDHPVAANVVSSDKEAEEANVIKFYAFEEQKLERDAPIYFAWPGESTDVNLREKSAFRYNPE